MSSGRLRPFFLDLIVLIVCRYFIHTTPKKNRPLRWQLLQNDAHNQLMAWPLLHCHTFNELLMHHFKTMAYSTNDFNHYLNWMEYSYFCKSNAGHYIATEVFRCLHATTEQSSWHVWDFIIRLWIRAKTQCPLNLKCDGKHDDVIKWKHFPRYWPFVRRIHRSPVNSPHKGQWRGALMFSLICTWINSWVNNPEAGDLRRHRAHCDVSVMSSVKWAPNLKLSMDNSFYIEKISTPTSSLEEFWTQLKTP